MEIPGGWVKVVGIPRECQNLRENTSISKGVNGKKWKFQRGHDKIDIHFFSGKAQWVVSKQKRIDKYDQFWFLSIFTK